MEDLGIDTQFVEAGEELSNGVGLVELVEHGAAGGAGDLGKLLVGELLVEQA